jgi:hypothetical protein
MATFRDFDFTFAGGLLRRDDAGRYAARHRPAARGGWMGV